MSENKSGDQLVADRRASFKLVTNNEIPAADTRVIDILAQVGKFDREILRTPDNPAYLFGSAVASAEASVVAVARIDGLDKERSRASAEAGLVAGKLAEFKEKYNIGINAGEKPTDTSIKTTDFKWGEIVVPGGLFILNNSDHPILPDKLEAFNHAYAKVPDGAKHAVKDYVEWYWGKGKYEGDTGIKLEGALKSGLVTPEEYAVIIKARDNGQKIILTDQPLETTETYKSAVFEDHRIINSPVTLDAWAVVPSENDNFQTLSAV